MKRSLALMLWCAALTASLAALHGPLVPQAPSEWTAAGVKAYASVHGPDSLVMALVWLAAVLAAWYLAATTAAGLLARGLRTARAVTVVDRVTVPMVRRLLGTGLAVSAVTAPASSAWATSPRGATSAPTPVVMVMESAPGNAPIIMTLEAPDPPVPTPPSTPAPSAEHVVQAGEHFWSIAHAYLTETTGRSPTNRDVAHYWQRLVAANKARLRVPSNPDLLFPGQRLLLPEAQ